MKLIGMNGLKTAGKDTTFELLREVTPGVVKRAGFADKLKIMAGQALGIEATDEDLIVAMNWFKENGEVKYTDPLAPNVWSSISGRTYLQEFGANARKVFGDSFWVDQVLPKPSLHPSRVRRKGDNDFALKDAFARIDYLCVTDVRYPNEALRIRQLGGEIWEIVRPGLESDGHSSEIPLDPRYVTATILNNGNIPELAAKVENQVKCYGMGAR